MAKASEGRILRILKAAQGILAENGYAATTISQIASQAGVSRGLLHYHFKNKEDMLARVIRRNMESIFRLIENIFHESQSPSQLAEKLTRALRETVVEDPDFFKLFLESWTLTRQGPAAAELLRDMHERFRQTVESGLHAMASQGFIEADREFSGLASLLTGIVDGIGMHMTLDPRLANDEIVWNTTRKAIEGLVEGKI